MSQQQLPEDLLKQAAAGADRVARELADDLSDLRARAHSRSAALKTGALKTGALKTGALKTGALDPAAREAGEQLIADAQLAARRLAELLQQDHDFKPSPESSP